MRHMLSIAAKLASVTVLTSLLIACDSGSLEDVALFRNIGDPDLFQNDVNFEVDPKTADIRINTSEELSLRVMQAVAFPNLEAPLFDYLDASKFPADPDTFCQNPDTDEREHGASFVSSQPAGTAHQVGETLTVRFTNCQLPNGIEVDGTFRLLYTSVAGVNDIFVPVSTLYCVDRLQTILAQETLGTGRYIVHYVVGDEVRFKPLGPNNLVEVYDHEFDPETNDRTDTLRSTLTIPKSQRVLIVNEKPNLPADALTSIDGDEIVSSFLGEQTSERCQYYRRSMRLDTTGLTVRNGTTETTLSGSISLRDVTDDLVDHSYHIVDSDFFVTVREGEASRTFSLEGISSELIKGVETGNYQLKQSGLATSSSIGGTVMLDASGISSFSGPIGEYPNNGFYRILGRGFERMTLTARGLDILVSVDYNGDVTGAGSSVSDISFLTSWRDLLARDFKEADNAN